MATISQYSDHFNLLIDKHLSPQWWQPLKTSSTQEGLSCEPLSLQRLTIQSIFKNLQENQLTLEDMKQLPAGIHQKLIFEARDFKEFILVKELFSDEDAKLLLKRFNLSRKFLERGTDREIFFKRIFEMVFNQLDPQEKINLIVKKRKCSLVNRSAYTLINIAEKVQAFLGKMLDSTLAKVSLTMIMVVITAVALKALYIIKPEIIVTIVASYLKIFDCVPWILNAMQPYYLVSLSLATISFTAGQFMKTSKPNLAEIFETTSAFSGFHFVCSVIGKFMGLPVSTVIYTIISGLPNGNIILVLPYLAPIIYPIMMLFLTADSSTSFASRILKTTSEKLMIWRNKKEIEEARDLWIKFLLKPEFHTKN